MVVKLPKQTLSPNGYGYHGPHPTISSPEEQALLKEELRQLEQMTSCEHNSAEAYVYWLAHRRL